MIVPSVSIAVRADIAVAPAVDGIVAFVILFATGGQLLTTTVTVVEGL